LAGAIGTATAIAIAYTLFPPFLKLASHRPAADRQRIASSPFKRLDGARYVAGFLILVVVAAFGVLRVDTDPDLLSYFAQGDPLRAGLEAVDRDGGSSPLNIVVQNATGERIDNGDTVDRMWDLHLALENDSAVGSVVSPALILAEARTAPFVGRLPPAQLLDLLQVTPLRATIAAYIQADRQQGLYSLRMHEAGRSETRDAVIDRIVSLVRARQLEPVLVGGLYEQQGQLGKLIASSLRLGLGGLIALFLGIAFYVSRDLRVTAAMVFSLAGIPLIVLGAFGYLGRPIDIISSPAANVALAMGVDSMIHLMMRARRRRAAGSNRREAWAAARDELWQPIVGAALIISAGFGIFSLSTFPPTQKFGLAVILGTVAAATTALLVLPQAAAGRLRSDRAAVDAKAAADDAKALENADPQTSPR
jgi:predicted RND superfamily exporter protein